MERRNWGGGGHRRRWPISINNPFFQHEVGFIYNRHWAAKVNFVIPERRGRHAIVAVAAAEPVPDRLGKSSFLRCIWTEIRPSLKSEKGPLDKAHRELQVWERKGGRRKARGVLVASPVSFDKSVDLERRINSSTSALALSSLRLPNTRIAVYTRPVIDSCKRSSAPLHCTFHFLQPTFMQVRRAIKTYV